jgi:hypothetical protein
MLIRKSIVIIEKGKKYGFLRKKRTRFKIKHEIVTEKIAKNIFFTS